MRAREPVVNKPSTCDYRRRRVLWQCAEAPGADGNLDDMAHNPTRARTDDSEPGQPSLEPAPGAVDGHSRWPALAAAAFGILGIFFALVVPLLPVVQTTSHVSWPEGRQLNPVTLPLVAYYPQNFDAAIPCTAVAELGTGEGAGNVLVSTAPAAAEHAGSRGLSVSVAGAQVEVRSRGALIASAPVDQVAAGQCQAIAVHSDGYGTSAEFTGLSSTTGLPSSGHLEGDFRPQVVGIYSDLGGAAPDGLSVDVEVDSRYTTHPTLLKQIALLLGVLMVLGSLVCIHRLDLRDGRSSRRFAPEGWWRPRLLDGLVAGTLVLWHVIGANTSDDGYILTEARAAAVSGYMPEVFRYYGAPYAPFGMPYYLYTAMSEASVASIWLRLPTLLLAFATWFLISREVIPRLGVAARHHRAVRWTAAAVFLVFWLTYNNGIRPEPIVAFGLVATWVSLERALATGRLLPAAVAFIIGGLTLSAAPTGTFCIAAIIAASRPLLVLIVRRGRRDGYVATIAPLLAAGLGILHLIFLDQPLRGTLDSVGLLGAVGPNGSWYEEVQRYEALFNLTPDGSLSRRFAVLAMVLALVACTAIMFRKGRIPGVALGPSRRIIGLSALSMAFMTFNPTKWTHHFGAFASIGAMLGALVTLALLPAATRSVRNRVLFIAAVLFILALGFTATNGWWYISIYGIPWGGAQPSVKGIELYTVFFAAMLVAVVIGLLLHYREAFVPPRDLRPEPQGRVRVLALELLRAPLGLAAGFVVFVMVASMFWAVRVQYPAYSVGLQNWRGLQGQSCGIADAVLAEPDANQGLLTPVNVPVERGLDPQGNSVGFSPDGIAEDLTATVDVDSQGPSTGTGEFSTAATEGTVGGTTAQAGVNGSRAQLPFGLDPAQTPVLGSYQDGRIQISGHVTTDWYRLPPPEQRGLLLAVAVAGHFPSDALRMEYTTDPAAGPEAAVAGQATPIDIGPAPAWRNLRVPLDQIPAEASAVRIVALDFDPDPDAWTAITPPRMPVTQTLQELVGSQVAVLPDWAVAFHVPCVRPFEEYAGVHELPEYRIRPDRSLAVSSTDTWQGWDGGGPLGFIELTLTGETVPTYLTHDWKRDWGSLVRYTPIVPEAKPATVEHGEVVRSGLWNGGPLAK